MKYYKVETCYLKDHDLCMIDYAPWKVRAVDFKLSDGDPIADIYPNDMSEATVFMAEDWIGNGLGGLISNTCRFLIVNTAIKKLISQIGAKSGEIEFLRVAIHDHKKRMASDDYWFINPIGQVDCLELTRSVVKRTKEGDVIRVKKMVLAADRIDPEKAIFRVKENPSCYIIRHDLLMAIKDLNLPTPNIYVEELEVTGADE